MTLDERMDKLENDVLPRLHAAMKELSEAEIVISHMQARQANVLKGNAEWLEEHEKRMAKYDEEIAKLNAESARSRADTDARIAGLVSAIGKLLAKTQ
jgi:hypothetical protein